MPLIDCPQQVRIWTTDRSNPVRRLPRLLAQTDGGVPNCDLPARIIRLVRGGHYNTPIPALVSNRLYANPNSVTDHGKAGSLYIYFRVMMQHETPATMAFNSVGSAPTEYKTRMVFDTRIWTQSRGGYVCSYDARGTINTTPFSQTAQSQTFSTILQQSHFTRGSAELAIYSSVSMADLTSVWVVFPYSLERMQRYLPACTSRLSVSPTPKIITPCPQPTYHIGQAAECSCKSVHPVKSPPDLPAKRPAPRRIRRPAAYTKRPARIISTDPVQVALQRYTTLLSYLPHAEDMCAISGSSCHWIKFSLSGGI